jgi:hypothetical protein
VSWIEEREEFVIRYEAEDGLHCDYCGAEPGEACVTKSGQRASRTHDARTRLLYAAWRDGYAEGWQTALDAAARDAPFWRGELAERKTKLGKQTA